MNSNSPVKVFGYKSLFIRVCLYTIPCLFFLHEIAKIIALLAFFVVAFNAWSMPFLQRISLCEKYLQSKSIYGVGKNKTINWNEVTGVSLHHLWWGRFDYRMLYIHKTKGRIYKINITNYLWFERKALLKYLECFTTVKRDVYPKLWDLM